MRQSRRNMKRLAALCLLLCLSFPGAVNGVEVVSPGELECECDPVGAAGCEGDNGGCTCKRGVGGMSCDQCLPGWTNLTEDGCSLVECACHPNGSISQECNSEGECVCHAGAMGNTCDVCRFGFHRVEQGCVSCPECFDEVAILFDKTVILYNELLLQLNDTLSGNNDGQPSQELLKELQQYRMLLDSLLQRAINATAREGQLKELLDQIVEETNSLRDFVDQFEGNVTSAELATRELSQQTSEVQALFEELAALLDSIVNQVRSELPEQLSNIQSLYKELRNEFDRLVELSTQANDISLAQEAQATLLLSRANSALANATAALQILNEAIAIQNKTLLALRTLEDQTLPSLLELLIQGRSSLTNAERDVPLVLAKAKQVLQAVLNLSLPVFDLESRRRELDDLWNQTRRLNESVVGVNSDLDTLTTNFTRLNTTAVELLLESRELNSKAKEILLQAHGALTFANSTAEQGNMFILEVQQLLDELQARLDEGRDFTAGLEEVIRNIELAESSSTSAENEAEEGVAGVRRAAEDVSIATGLLEEASTTLQEALRIATEVNMTASEILANATSLNSSATDLVENVGVATATVDTLQDAVVEDQEAIARVTDTATETISLATNLSEWILVIKEELFNLSRDLNATTLLPPQQLLEVNTTLTSLEQQAETNQQLIDTLVEQVGELQASADQLRDRYTQLRQHRDLLQTILSNVEDLDCLSQFATN